MSQWSCTNFCTSVCTLCPDLRLDLSPAGAPTCLEPYPIAGEEFSRAAPSDASPASSAVSNKSWDARIPIGVLARNEQGLVEVVPPAVHRQLKRTKTLVMPGVVCQPDTMASTMCEICFADELKDPVTFDCRAHVFCSDCARRHCQECLSSCRLPGCPGEGCKAEASVDLLSKLLGAADFEQYLLISLRATKRFHTCPGVACGAAIYIEEGHMLEPGLAAAVRCPRCGRSFCPVCFQAAHPRRTCEEARRRAQRRCQASARYSEDLAEGLEIRPCPRCGAKICKSSGDDCDHMKCSQCAKEFCWSCSADRDTILQHGNHFHEKGCRFFAPYDGPLEYLPDRCRECRRRGRPCRPWRKR